MKASSSGPQKETSPFKRRNGYSKGHQWVDLGLSVKWATCNINAWDFSDYGDYFAFGEITNDHRIVIRRTYEGFLGLRTIETQYLNFGYSVYKKPPINNIAGNIYYDIARNLWGGNWRMPTDKEFEELLAKCICRGRYVNNSWGLEAIGPNGNSIYFPAAGHYETKGNSFILKAPWCVGFSGTYRTSIREDRYGDTSRCFYFDRGVASERITYRKEYFGYSIRPVLDFD